MWRRMCALPAPRGRNPLRVLLRPKTSPSSIRYRRLDLCHPCTEHFAAVRAYLDGRGLAYEVCAAWITRDDV